MTQQEYEDKIDGLITQINVIYNTAGSLRDYAGLDEKKYWNDLRRIFYDADKPMRNLNDFLYEKSRKKSIKI